MRTLTLLMLVATFLGCAAPQSNTSVLDKHNIDVLLSDSLDNDVLDSVYAAGGRYPVINEFNILFYLASAEKYSPEEFVNKFSVAMHASKDHSSSQIVLGAQRDIVHALLEGHPKDGVAYLKLPNIELNRYDFKKQSILLPGHVLITPTGPFRAHDFTPFNGVAVSEDDGFRLEMDHQRAEDLISASRHTDIDVFLKVQIIDANTRSVPRIDDNGSYVQIPRASIRVPNLKVSTIGFVLVDRNRKRAIL